MIETNVIESHVRNAMRAKQDAIAAARELVHTMTAEDVEPGFAVQYAEAYRVATRIVNDVAENMGPYPDRVQEFLGQLLAAQRAGE